MTLVPFTVAVPCVGAVAMAIPVTALPAIFDARLIVVGVLSCTVNDRAPLVGRIVKGTFNVPVPVLLVALKVTLKEPVSVGVPEITPVVVFKLRPGGSPLAA